MGCCYSFFCNDDGNSQNGEPNERTHLVNAETNNINIQGNNSDDYLNLDKNASPKKSDEQSALNRILQEIATNVIDVAALDAHNLQQHEYLDRVKMYNLRIQQVLAANRQPYKVKTLLLQDVSSADKILAAEPISVEDYHFVTSMLSKASLAIKEIKVEHKEDLVVPFRIP